MTNLKSKIAEWAEEFASGSGSAIFYVRNVKAVKYGANKVLEELESAPGEFDKDAALLQISQTPPDEWTALEVDKFMQGARWQFDRSKARIGIAEQVAKDNAKLWAQIEQMKERLAESERRVSGNAQTAMCFIDDVKALKNKLAAAERRVKELEGALEAKLSNMNCTCKFEKYISGNAICETCELRAALAKGGRE